MYFETGQGSALSAEAHHGMDQQTCEARAYAVHEGEEILVATMSGTLMALAPPEAAATDRALAEV